VVLLGVGSATAADATTDDPGTGSMAGHLVDQDGHPVVDAFVSVEGDTTFHFASTFTDADGFWRLTRLPPDDYRVRFEPLDGPAQYAFGKWEFFEADLIPVVAGEEAIVDDQLLPFGTITGQLLGSDGDPAAFAQVFAEPVEGGSFEGVSTDEDGLFTLRVAPGEYIVAFEAGGPTQYAFVTFDFLEAEIFSVGPGETVVVNDQLRPLGTITGTLSDHPGGPVEGAGVHATEVDGGPSGFTVTDEDGGFTLQVPPGRYRVSFDVDQLSQYAFGTLDFSQAEIFDVSAGEVVTVNDTLIATGAVEGRFTNRDGTGIEGVEVNLEPLEPALPFYFTETDDTGSYHLLRVAPGSYRVRFTSFEENFEQYAFGVVDRADAAVIVVDADETVVVDDTRLPTGSVRVTTRDALTGEPVMEFSLFLGIEFVHTTTGEVLLTGVPVGTHRITFASADGYSYRDLTTVTVVEDEVAEVTLTFHPKARVETTVVDAVTGEPVEGVCLIPATTTQFIIPEWCPEVSGPDGRVTVEVDRGGVYHFLAWPRDAEGYGAQWVGHHGGTGFQLAAARVTVPEGGVATAPVVRMDRAGTVTGTVTLPDGTVATSGTVSIGNEPFNVGGGLGLAAIARQGRYTIDWLGPYQWPLYFDVPGYARQWSGGSPERHTADRVPVVSGATTTYDQRLEPGTEVTVSIDLGQAFLVALNARTGDRVGVWTVLSDPELTSPVLGPQRIKFVVIGGDSPARFIGGDDFDSATTYTIRPHRRQVIVLE